MTQTTRLTEGMVIDGYEIVSCVMHGREVLGVNLPPDAFVDNDNDQRFPAPTGYEWDEGMLEEFSHFVSLIRIS